MNRKHQFFNLAISCIKDSAGGILCISAVLVCILLLHAFSAAFIKFYFFIFNTMAIPFIFLNFVFLFSSFLLKCMLIKDEKEGSKVFGVSNLQSINNYLIFSVLSSSACSVIIVVTIFILSSFNTYNFILSWLLFITVGLLFFNIPKKIRNSMSFSVVVDILYSLFFVLLSFFSFLVIFLPATSTGSPY